jgi:carbon starvation protein
VVIVFVAGIVVAFRTIRGGGRPLSEDEPVPSKRFAPSGLISTAAEKELQRQWDGTPDRHVAPKSPATS